MGASGDLIVMMSASCPEVLVLSSTWVTTLIPYMAHVVVSLRTCISWKNLLFTNKFNLEGSLKYDLMFFFQVLDVKQI